MQSARLLRLQLSSTQSNETVKKRCHVTTNQVTRNPGRLDRPAVRCPGVSEEAPAACKRCPRRAARDRKFRHAVLISGFSSDRVSEVCCPRPRNSNTKNIRNLARSQIRGPTPTSDMLSEIVRIRTDHRKSKNLNVQTDVPSPAFPVCET